MYGKGYRINVKSIPEFHPQLIEIVKKNFGQQIEFETIAEDPEFIVFIIKNSAFCLSKAFELFEDELSRTGKIKRYEIK